MSRIRQTKTTFSAGEVSRDLLGRGDLRAYENGALTLRNIFIHPTGGVSRRAGLRHIDTARGPGRLIAFEFNTEQTYLLVVTGGMIDIYADDVLAATLSAPWAEDEISGIAWTQSADTLLLVHPDVAPHKLTRNSGGDWSLEVWSFFEDEDGVIRRPMFKFAGTQVTLTPSALSGTIALTAGADVFVAAHEGTRLRVGGKEVEIVDYDSPTVVSARTIEDLESTDETIDWEEQAFSAVHGWPVTVAFHQDRLVIGGSRDLPNRLWMSKSGDLFNFDLGTGLDDESIEFAILSDQVNAIRGIFSGRHLQVFTSGAEWMVTGDPLTPETVQLKRQTRIGSVVGRYIPPVNVDGATLFVSRSRREIREFLYTDLEAAYQASDLALLSRHLIIDPVDQDFDASRRLLFVVREDGKFATLTVFRSESVAAWTLHETQGQALSVAVVGEETYLLVARGDPEDGGDVMIEKFDDALQLDAALDGTADSPQLTWSGLDHLAGQSVRVVADRRVVDAQTVSAGGEIVLDEAARSVQAGLPYTHIIEPLPPNEVNDGGASRAVRLVQGLFRIEETAALSLDVGRGLQDVPLRDLDPDFVLGSAARTVSGQVRVRAYGWHRTGDTPLWRIEQDVALPFTLLSVTTEMKVSM